jgi:hypothetical protein
MIHGWMVKQTVMLCRPFQGALENLFTAHCQAHSSAAKGIETQHATPIPQVFPLERGTPIPQHRERRESVNQPFPSPRTTGTPPRLEAG